MVVIVFDALSMFGSMSIVYSFCNVIKAWQGVMGLTTTYSFVNILAMLKIRLQRVGRKNDPSFRVVLTDSKRGPKSGDNIELLGSYNPHINKVQIDGDRVKHWISVGAQVSDTVHNLLIKEKIIEGKKINVLPKKSPIVKEATEEEKKAEEAKEETPVEEKTEEKVEKEAPKEEVKEEASAKQEEKPKEEPKVEEKKEETPAEPEAPKEEPKEEKEAPKEEKKAE